MRLFRLSARLCSCGIYFPSKVRKLKYNRGMMMLYTRSVFLIHGKRRSPSGNYPKLTSIHETVLTESEVVFVWNLFSFQGAKIKVQQRDGDVVVHETVSFLYMVREKPEWELRYMRLFGPLEGMNAKLCLCGIYFPSKVRKLKYNRGMMMLLYMRQYPSYTW